MRKTIKYENIFNTDLCNQGSMNKWKTLQGRDNNFRGRKGWDSKHRSRFHFWTGRNHWVQNRHLGNLWGKHTERKKRQCLKNQI
jgi:hypothetical protein